MKVEHSQNKSAKRRQSPSNRVEMDGAECILPGATIGMVGGGQLGRMFAMAAAAMGYEVVVLCESESAPAAQVANRCVLGDLDDPIAVEAFAGLCDVITLEFENIPAKTIAACGQFAPTYPSASVLAIAQDRIREKTTLRDAGLPVTPMRPVDGPDSLLAAGEELGWPLIVKTARSGYDGKGQSRVESRSDAERFDWGDCQHWIAEQCIAFDQEVSVVVARTVTGRKRAFPVFENVHHRHILDVSVAPAGVAQEVSDEAIRVAFEATETLQVVGLLCVEFFVRHGEVMINEVAPRPHNSGHLTIEGCHTSQFQQHVRAICNLPLGNTALRSGAAVMANLLGDLWCLDGNAPPWHQALQDDSINLHLYGKETAKPGRKMGHMTAVGNDVESTKTRVLQARSRLKASQSP